MITKRLQLIYSEDGTEVSDIFFNSWKELHIHLFEHGLYKEFQVIDQYGTQQLHYLSLDGKNKLYFTDDVPGSVLFEIVNRHASAHL